MNIYNFHEDPGHGWLEVPMSEIKELGLTDKISPCSYKKGNMVYLEEDCDAPLFADAYKEKYGGKIKLKEIIYNREAPLRNYQSYR